MPITDAATGKGMNAVYLSRVNFLHEEPGRNRHRLFVNDLNGPLYMPASPLPDNANFPGLRTGRLRGDPSHSNTGTNAT
jgi:hypothetical protein